MGIDLVGKLKDTVKKVDSLHRKLPEDYDKKKKYRKQIDDAEMVYRKLSENRNHPIDAVAEAFGAVDELMKAFEEMSKDLHDLEFEVTFTNWECLKSF